MSLLTTTVRVATGLVTLDALLKSLGAPPTLGWLGLARRRHPLSTLAVLAAGAVVGAGAALLIAPSSGLSLRRWFVGAWQRAELEERVDEAAEPMSGTSASSPRASNDSLGLT